MNPCWTLSNWWQIRMIVFWKMLELGTTVGCYSCDHWSMVWALQVFASWVVELKKLLNPKPLKLICALVFFISIIL